MDGEVPESSLLKSVDFLSASVNCLDMEIASIPPPILAFESIFCPIMEAFVMETVKIAARLLLGLIYVHASISETSGIRDSFSFQLMSKGKKAEGENVDDGNIGDDGAGHCQCGGGANGENGDAFDWVGHSSDGEDDHETDEGDAGDEGGKDDGGEEEEEDDDDSYYEDEDEDEEEECKEDDEEDEEQSYSSDMITTSGSEDDMDDDPLLGHAMEVYAVDSFSLFEHEYEKSETLTLEVGDVTGDDEVVFMYEVTRRGHRGHTYKVIASPSDDSATCCCKRFEVTGILCSHALAVLKFMRVKEIPDQYLLKWRMKSTNKSLLEEPFSRKKRQCQPSLDDCLSGELGRGSIKTNASEEDSGGTLSCLQDNNCAGSDHLGSPILRHAKQIYVSEIYDLFREEYWKSEYLRVNVAHQAADGRGLIYEFEVYMRYGDPDTQKVHAEAKDGTVKCSCRKFEKSGILCSHALAVFGVICLVRIPQQYLVPKLLKDLNMSVSVQQKIHGPDYDELLRFACFVVKETGRTALLSSFNFGDNRVEECLLALKDEKEELPQNDMKEKGASGSGMQEMAIRGKAKFYDDHLLQKPENRKRKLWEYLKRSSP